MSREPFARDEEWGIHGYLVDTGHDRDKTARPLSTGPGASSRGFNQAPGPVQTASTGPGASSGAISNLFGACGRLVQQAPGPVRRVSTGPGASSGGFNRPRGQFARPQQAPGPVPRS